MNFNDVLTILWFFLPAGLANMVPVFAAKLPWLKKFDYPMDFNLTFRGKRILGSHKTIRGLLSGIVIGAITVLVQNKLFLNYEILREFISIDYLQVNWLILGSLLGAGAIIGDSIKSFFKRQWGIASGEAWFFFDQIDYIMGGIIFSAFYLTLAPIQYLLIIFIFFVLHMAVTVIGYLLGLKEQPI
jgi:CDP-2,3-bis-(O-geranylgeranyl)-sn-glycerol synthase